MAHFAELDGNTVTQVLVVANEDTADEEGNELKISHIDKQLAGRTYKVVTEESMDLLHADVIRELSEELTKVNSLSEKESKNSEG